MNELELRDEIVGSPSPNKLAFKIHELFTERYSPSDNECVVESLGGADSGKWRVLIGEYEHDGGESRLRVDLMAEINVQSHVSVFASEPGWEALGPAWREIMSTLRQNHWIESSRRTYVPNMDKRIQATIAHFAIEKHGKTQREALEACGGLDPATYKRYRDNHLLLSEDAIENSTGEKLAEWYREKFPPNHY